MQLLSAQFVTGQGKSLAEI